MPLCVKDHELINIFFSMKLIGVGETGTLCTDQDLIQFSFFNEADWRWRDGSSSSYRNWDWPEPLHDGKCVILKSNGKWNDVPCGDEFRYICRKSRTCKF